MPRLVAAGPGSAGESAADVQQDDGDSVRSGSGAAGRVQAAVAHRRTHVCVPDPAAHRRHRSAQTQRGAQPESASQGSDTVIMIDRSID